MKINSDLLKGSSVDGIIYANNFKCKNWFIPTLYSDESLIVRSGVDYVSLSGDEYTFVANATDMYFGQVSNVGAAYIKSNGILYDVSNMKKISFNITNSDFNTILITTYNSSKISLGYGIIRSNKGTYTIPSGAKYMTFRFGTQNAVPGTTYKTKVQIETGDVITDYTPYKNFENEEIEETKINTAYNCYTRKIGNMVQLAVQFSSSSNPVNISGYATISLGTVPNNCRPSAELMCPCYVKYSSGGTNVVYFAVNTTGSVRLFNWGTALTGVENISSIITYIVN